MQAVPGRAGSCIRVTPFLEGVRSRADAIEFFATRVLDRMEYSEYNRYCRYVE